MTESLNSRMNAYPRHSNHKFDVLILSGDYIQKLGDHVHSFVEQIAKGLGTITFEPDEHFRRVVRLLNKELTGMLDGYDDVRSRTPFEEDFEGWKLLVQIYEEALRQIREWLADVMDYLNDPFAETQKHQKSVDGKFLVTLQLDMKAPKQMDSFKHWLERTRDEILATHEDDLILKQNRKRIGSAELTLGILFAAMTGWG